MAAAVPETAGLWTGRALEPAKDAMAKDDFVVVVPLSADGTVTCVDQKMLHTSTAEVCFPTGFVMSGETAEAAARRILTATTTCKADRLVRVAQLREAPEFLRSTGTVYVAEGLTADGAGSGDSAAPKRVEERELRRLVRTGHIQSATTIAAVHHYLDFVDRRRLSSDARDLRREGSTASTGMPCPFPSLFMSLVRCPLESSSSKVAGAAMVVAYLAIQSMPQGWLQYLGPLGLLARRK
eukprot:TRINITY_DN41264_c0_g1_i1.p1 TRINITY_DN41264_c0_g1~~TRINITY_DN41264_c0_g1_i1.p1  ORF type:complete len:266 (+),score=24.01 TRINITY_DN41264_c0_g1_i1:84-800(+)